jgi:hypothetical protein
MRVSKVITALIASVLTVFLLLVYCQFTRKFIRFEHRSTRYHADFAAACGSILAHYPLGTKRFVEISPADASLPGIVRDLHPERIKVATNWVWILVDGSHLDGLNVTWAPQDEARTNTWNLVIGNGEGPSKVVYAAKR